MTKFKSLLVFIIACLFTGLQASAQTPGVKIMESENGICAGKTVTFTARVVNGGTASIYQWMVNGVNVGANSNQYASSTLMNGDMVSCAVTCNVPNASPAIVVSNIITMTVNPLLTPAVTIAASQNPLHSGVPVKLTAMVVNGGTAPIYQWLLNGAFVGGNSDTFSYLPANNDIVRCVVTSNAACLTTTIADRQLVINVIPPIPTGVAEASDAQVAASLFPNPNNGSFILKGTAANNAGHTITAEVISGIGQRVYQQAFPVDNGAYEQKIELPASLSAGNYFLKVNDGNSRVIRFVVADK